MSDDLEYQKKQNALTTIVNAVRIAQKRGAFSLEEAAVLHVAIQVFSEDNVATAEDSKQ